MTDTRVLKLLGVQPKIGTKFTVTYQIGGVQSEPKTVTSLFSPAGGITTSFPGEPCDRAEKLREKDIAACGDRGGRRVWNVDT